MAARLDKGLALATDLLKAEGGDPKVVFAAVLLQKADLDQAGTLLAELETEPEIAQSILEVLESDQWDHGHKRADLPGRPGPVGQRPGQGSPSAHPDRAASG